MPEIVERVRAVADGATINGTYKLHPGDALAAFRADLQSMLSTLQPSQVSGGEAIPSSDMTDILETIGNAADDWQSQGYPTALAEVRDMADIGRDVMEGINSIRNSPGPFANWTPMDSPAEIVTDLANALDEAIASPKTYEDGVREAAEPFIRAYALQAPLNPPDDAGIRGYLPGTWPTMGDLRRLHDAATAIEALIPGRGEK